MRWVLIGDDVFAMWECLIDEIEKKHCHANTDEADLHT